MLSNFQPASASLHRSLAFISVQPELSVEEEASLARRARRGDVEAARELASATMRRVIPLARTFQGKGLPLEDLLHEGCRGLMEAARRYDPARGTRFFTYAAFLVRRHLVQAVATGSKTVRVPRHVSARIRRQREGALPGDASAAPGGPCATYELSLDRGEAALELRSLVARASTSDLLPDAALLEDERLGELRSALAMLPAREREILTGRHGLDGEEPRTLRQMGARMRLSKERVRQLEERALATLRRRLFARLCLVPDARPTSA